MVTVSSQAPMLSSFSRNRDTPNTIAATAATAPFRGSFSWVDRASLQASIMLIREVIPAKNTDTKNKMANSRPIGMFWNT